MKDKNQVDFTKLKELLERNRRQFEMEVEATCLEIVDIAKQISPAIGREVSVVEAKNAVIREFAKRLKQDSFYDEFAGKIK